MNLGAHAPVIGGTQPKPYRWPHWLWYKATYRWQTDTLNSSPDQRVGVTVVVRGPKFEGRRYYRVEEIGAETTKLRRLPLRD